MATPASPATEQNAPAYRFDEGFQRRIAALLIAYPPCWPAAQELARPDYFDSTTLSDLVRIVQAYYAKYKRPPSLDDLWTQLVEFLKPIEHDRIRWTIYTDLYANLAELILDETQNWAFVHDKMVAEAQYQAHKNAIIKSVDLLKDHQDYEGIEKAFQEARAVGEGGPCGLDIVDLADVERKEVRWFWLDKIPRAKLSLIVGDPGIGKSWFTLFLAAAVTAGYPLPGAHGRETEQGRVVILSAEDEVDDTIVPRIEDSGGDKGLVHVIQGTREGKMFSLMKDLGRLENYVREKGDVRLIIIDPISAYLGIGEKVNSHKDSDVRGILSPLVRLAKEQDVTIIGVMHLNKSQDLGAIYRVSGSMAFVAQARAVWLMTAERREGEDHSLRYFSPLKVNLALVKEPLVWRVNDRGAVAFVESGTMPPSIEEQLAPPAPKRPSKLDEAKRFLLRLLQGGDTVETTVIEQMAADEGLSPTTLDRAKKALGVESRKKPGADGAWTWVLPEAGS
jgi:putative DNA primase/helicase